MSHLLSAPHDSAQENDHPLARAFRSFTEAAGSLEKTYGQLQDQVTWLRQELEVTNRSLTASLEENRQIRERLRKILEGLPCGVLVLAEDGRITALNPEASRILGNNYQAVDALPSSLSAALDQARQAEEEVLFHKFVSDEDTPVSKAAGTPGGESGVWVAIRHAWLEKNSRTQASVFILRDVSAEKQFEHDRENLRRQQALVEVSALLAHEIRNPLGSLELFGGLLAESPLEEESHRWVEHIQAGLRTLSATVNNVLDLHNEPPAEPTPIDAGDLLDWAYEFLLPLSHQARVEFEVINEIRGVQIKADRHLLELVLLNLALNAFHFMPTGGWLVVRGTANGESNIELEVRDTGPGIPEENLPRIFEAGFTTRPGSTGLGLAVCRRILDQHGGGITAESHPGCGATFRVRLPQAAKLSAVAGRLTAALPANDVRTACNEAASADGSVEGERS